MQRLLVVCAHGDASYVHVTVGHRQHAQVFLRRSFALRGKFCHCRTWCRLRGLSSRIGVDLRIQYEHVDVAPGGQHVIEAAKADLVCRLLLEKKKKITHIAYLTS